MVRQHADALRDLTTATRLQPSLTDAWRWLGRTAYSHGDSGLAYNSFQSALASDPNDQDILQYHVESDVLLINEIRAALGLEGVSWGDRTPLQRRVELGVERLEGRRTDEEKEAGDAEDGDATKSAS